jgi:hypothetical protein
VTNAPSPGLDCITGLHLHVDVFDERGGCVGGWCVWCGTAAYDGDRITEDGRAIGFTASYRMRMADDFHRDPARGSA